MRHWRKITWVMRMAAGLGAMAAFAVVPAVSVAHSEHAPTVSCHIQPATSRIYQGDVAHLRIRMADRRVDHVLPRCALANLVAQRAQEGVRIGVEGRDWNAGFYTCDQLRPQPTGRPDQVEVTTRCVHRGRDANTVWFDNFG